jgi:hypothetical protein
MAFCYKIPAFAGMTSIKGMALKSAVISDHFVDELSEFPDTRLNLGSTY